MSLLRDTSTNLLKVTSSVDRFESPHRNVRLTNSPRKINHKGGVEDKLRQRLNKARNITDELNDSHDYMQEKFAREETDNLFHVEATNQFELFRTYGLHYHWKIFRRQLIVALWLRVLLNWRNRLRTFMDVILPVIVMLVFISGFTVNTTWGPARFTSIMQQDSHHHQDGTSESTIFFGFFLMQHTKGN